MNHGTVREHISIYSDLNLVRSFAISVNYKRKMTFEDFLLIDDTLFIANSLEGLGVFKIKKSYFKENEYDTFNTQIDESRVKYKKIKNGKIIKLIRIPNEQKIILAIKNIKGKIRNEIIEIQ